MTHGLTTPGCAAGRMTWMGLLARRRVCVGEGGGCRGRGAGGGCPGAALCVL